MSRRLWIFLSSSETQKPNHNKKKNLTSFSVLLLFFFFLISICCCFLPTGRIQNRNETIKSNSPIHKVGNYGINHENQSFFFKKNAIAKTKNKIKIANAYIERIGNRKVIYLSLNFDILVVLSKEYLRMTKQNNGPDSMENDAMVLPVWVSAIFIDIPFFWREISNPFVMPTYRLLPKASCEATLPPLL